MKKLTLVLIAIASLAAGCNTARVAGVETKAPSDPKGEVIAASRKLFALNSLTGKVDAVGETSFHKEVQYAAPDRFHVSYRDDTGAEMEMVMDGHLSYIKSGDSWNKMPGDDSPTPTLRNAFTEEVLKTVSDAKYEGEETIDGKPALVYTYKYSTIVGDFPAKAKVWISKATGLPIKTIVDFEQGLTKTRTTTFDTESPVTVNLPAK